MLFILSTIVATESPSCISIEVDSSQLIQASRQSLYIVCLDTEKSIVLEVFGHWPISNLFVFRPELSALMLDFFLNELTFQSVHRLLNFLLRRSRT